MKLGGSKKSFTDGEFACALKRTTAGVVEVEGDTAFGLGVAHAHDRMVQMLISRVVAQGRIAEKLVDNAEALSFDLFIRKLGFYPDARTDQNNLSPQALQETLQYCAGFNHYLKTEWPLGLGKLLPFKPQPWELVDTLAVLKLHTYLGLAQIQEGAERLIIQAIKEGVDTKKLQALFSPHLKALSLETIELLQKVPLENPFLKNGLHFLKGIAPAFSSSNNWALAPKKTTTGGTMVAFDPHLQINRLPPIWYEVILKDKKGPLMGITAPGIPGVLMGRTPHLSAGFTYGQMDQIDFFIEERRGETVLREKEWVPLQKREEVIHRKKHPALHATFYESDCGVLEGNHEGLTLAMKWANQKRGSASCLNALSSLWRAQTVQEALPHLSAVTLSSNWVLADSAGNIALQQAGRAPKREGSGLLPLVAWNEKNHWKGWVAFENLYRELNPKEGFVASANDDKNQKGQPHTINLPIASYRIDRIQEVLSQKGPLSLEDQKKLQCDRTSLQARIFLNILYPLLPDTPLGHLLKTWDGTYSQDSLGATLFEAFYKRLLTDVFGPPFFGEKAWEHILKNTSFFSFHYGLLDTVLLKGDENLWFGKEGRIGCYKKVLQETLSSYEKSGIPPYKQGRSFYFSNILFDEKFPKFLGLDYGPCTLAGSRATVAQGQIFVEKGRKIVTGPSWRFVADLSTKEAFTSLPGGPSENRLSKYYTSELAPWLVDLYKKIDS